MKVFYVNIICVRNDSIRSIFRVKWLKIAQFNLHFGQVWSRMSAFHPRGAGDLLDRSPNVVTCNLRRSLWEGWLPPKLSLEFYYPVLIISLVFLMFSMMFAKTSLLFCCFFIRLFQTSMLLYIRVRMLLCETSMLSYIRDRMLLCETSMLLFVSVCCYAKPRCHYSSPYAVMRNLDAIDRFHCHAIKK